MPILVQSVNPIVSVISKEGSGGLVQAKPFFVVTRPWSVDSGHGGSGDVMKIPPIEKKM